MASRFMVPLKKSVEETDQEKRNAKALAFYNNRGKFTKK